MFERSTRSPGTEGASERGRQVTKLTAICLPAGANRLNGCHALSSAASDCLVLIWAPGGHDT